MFNNDDMDIFVFYLCSILIAAGELNYFKCKETYCSN